MNRRLTNKHILLAVTGGIAAYKSAEIIRLLQQEGAEVRVVMTQAAKEFVTAMTLQALSGHPVHDQLMDCEVEAGMGHIALARWADLLLIAPATADVMARFASGQANDLLTAIYLATTAQKIVAPAMNQQMWQALATQENVQRLQTQGVKIIGPDHGIQACGETGPGRLLALPALVDAVAACFTTGKLQGLNVLISAGPTREALDPVRFISNRSSGKMGYAVAEAAREAGASVHLISGPVALAAVDRVQITYVETAAQMQDAVLTAVGASDIFISSAAVTDYYYPQAGQQKLSKSNQGLTLQLLPTVDILASVTALPVRPFCVGFCAQTHDLTHYAKEKLVNKKLDMIAANWVGEHMAFDKDDNQLHVFWPGGDKALAYASKQQLARQLVELIKEKYDAKYSSKSA